MREKIRNPKYVTRCLCLILSILYILNPIAAAAVEVTVDNNKEDSVASTEYNDIDSDDSETQQNELHAFYPAYTSYSDKLQSYIDDVDSVSFAWAMFETNDPGNLNMVRGKNGNYSFYYPKDYIKPVTYAKSQGKSIQLSIFMSGKGSVNSLPYEDIRSTMLQRIVELMNKDITNGEGIYFDGVVIDFEGLRDTNSKKKPIFYNGKPISTYYMDFLTDLKEELVLMGKKLYVAVNVRDNFDGFNYTEILKVADRVILMAHSYDPGSSLRLTKNQALQYTGERSTRINSPAPIKKVMNALMDMQNAASDPADLKKVLLQICFAGVGWKFDVDSPKGWNRLKGSTLSKNGKFSLSYKSMKNIIDNAQGYGKNITYGYNVVLQSPFLQYYNTQENTWNIILYEDSNSITAKMDLVDFYEMGGISVWSLSNVPDYNDSKGTKFYMDGWATILSNMNKTVTTYP